MRSRGGSASLPERVCDGKEPITPILAPTNWHQKTLPLEIHI